MSRPALGKGLGKLMDGPAAEPRGETATKPAAPISPGMAQLLRPSNESVETGAAVPEGTGGQPDAKKVDAAVTPAGGKWGWRVPFIVADVLLVALTTYLVCSKHGPFGWTEGILCITAMGTGAWLACLALKN